MADDEPAVEEPLLVADQEDAWDAIEDGSRANPAITVQQLIRQDPDHVITHLAKKGVAKLGEFKVPDSQMLAALDGAPFLVMGADSRDIDVQREWGRYLARAGAAGKTDKAAGWSRRVAVEAFVVNIRDAAAPDEAGLINPLLKRYNAGGCHYSVFALPAVQAVLQYKWATFGGRMVKAELAAFLVWLLSFSAFMIMFQDEDLSLSLPELLATPTGVATVVAEALSLVAMSPFLVIELGSLRAYAGGWLSLWNLLDCTTYGLQIAIAVLHLGRLHLGAGWLSVLVSFQSILLILRLNYFSRVFGGSSSFSIIESMQQVVVDIRMYLLYLLLMIWAFACAFCVLFRRDQEHEQFNNIGHAMLTMFTWALGGVDLDVMLGTSNPEALLVLSLIYQFAMGTVLMSLLTGVMAQSLYKATAHEDMKRLLGKAQAIDELESTTPSCIERLLPHMYPAFVHVLRIDPLAMDDAVEGDQWHQQALVSGAQGTPLGDTKPGGGGGGGAAAADPSVKALVAEVAALRQQVRDLADLLHTAVPSLPPSPEAESRMLA